MHISQVFGNPRENINISRSGKEAKRRNTTCSDICDHESGLFWRDISYIVLESIGSIGGETTWTI